MGETKGRPTTTHIEVDADTAHFRTESFSLTAGQARSLCFATTLEADLTVQGYGIEATPLVRHVVLARPLLPEPDGMTECDGLFRTSWDPLFVAGGTPASFSFPGDAAHVLTKGTQIVAALQVGNSGAETVTASVEIDMLRSTAANPRSIGTFIFGTTSFVLPPRQRTELEWSCALGQSVHVIAALPQMLLMGRALGFDVAASGQPLHTVFDHGAYDFYAQHIETLDLELPAGAMTRVRCAYENTTDHPIRFGQTDADEMCFFAGFALDSTALRLCGRGGA